MTEVAFPLGSEGSEGLPQTNRRLKNCFNAGGPVLQRNGITSINTDGKVARGAFTFNEKLYKVSSNDLIRIDNVSTGAGTTIGTIAGTAAIDVAVSFTQAAIIVKGGNGYTLSTADALVQITDPQFVASNSVAQIGQRMVYIPTSGDPAFFSEVNDAGNILTTSFFDAEDLPDKNKVCFNFKGTLIIGGSNSFEQFRLITTDPIVPFRKINARIDNGFIGGLREAIDSFLYIGRDKDQVAGIYRLSPNGSTKISNEYIDTILEGYTVAQLEVATTQRWRQNGFDLAAFTLQDDSFGTLGGNWFDLDTRIDGENEPWAADYIVAFGQKYYVFDSQNFGVMSTLNTDYGNRFQRWIVMGFNGEGNFTLGPVTYRMSQGFNPAEGSVYLEMSDDNVLFGPPFASNTADQGHYMEILDWDYPGGLGHYENFAGMRISTAEDIDFSSSGLFIT